MVTHDGIAFVRRQFESIVQQTLLPAVLIVVDDASTDGTRDVLRELRGSGQLQVELIELDNSAISNQKTRIAANVAAGLAAARDYDVAVLADQDDVWLPDRLRSQRAVLAATGALLVAGDGLLVDAAGRRIGRSLRDEFPVPATWSSLTARDRMRYALRRPIVTGAASAMTRELVGLMSPIPAGWLHDRWATLVATARDRLALQPEPVIEYRIHPGQLLGRGQARTGMGRRRWRQVLDRGASPSQAASRTVQVVRRIRPLAADPGVRAELSLRALLGSAMESA